MSNFTATANQVEDCHYTVDINVPADDVSKAFKRIRNQVRGQAAIKGFRRGKAPDALLDRKFGDQINSEVSQQIIREALESALKDNDLSPVTMPSMVPEKEGKLSEGEEFVFSVEFDVKPEFELPEYKGLEIEKIKVEVTDDKVEETIQDMLKQQATYDKVDRAAEAGDMLKVGYTSELDGDEEVPEAAKRMLENPESWLLLSEPEMIPGVAEGLAGVSAGDEKDLESTFPEDHYEPFLAGKTVKYSFKIEEVHGKATPELDDEVAKRMGAEGVEDLKDKVRERMVGQVDDANRQHLNAQVIDKLLEKVEFVVPPKQLESEIAQSLMELKRQQQQQEQRGEAAEAKEEGELTEEAEKQALNRLRLRYLVEEIAKKEELEVTPDEVKTQIDVFKMYSRLSDQEFRQRYDEMRMAEAFYMNILQEKVVSKLVEEANVTETEPKEDEASEA